MASNVIELAARRLAEANARSESTITRIYWFPDEKQIRLVEVDEESIRADRDQIEPIWFAAVPDIPFPSGIALIHPDEEGFRQLPKEWGGDWSKGIVIFDRQAG